MRAMHFSSVQPSVMVVSYGLPSFAFVIIDFHTLLSSSIQAKHGPVPVARRGVCLGRVAPRRAAELPPSGCMFMPIR